MTAPHDRLDRQARAASSSEAKESGTSWVAMCWSSSGGHSVGWLVSVLVAEWRLKTAIQTWSSPPYVVPVAALRRC